MSPPLRAASLAAKLGALGAVLMLVALGSIALTLWVTWQLEGGAAAVNEAGRLRMQTWRLAQAVGSGDGERLRDLAGQYDRSLELLRRGDPARPLFIPADDVTRAAFDAVDGHWATLRGQWLGGARPRPAEAAAEAERLASEIDRFVGRIEHRMARWTALLTVFQLSLVGLAIAAAVALLYAAHLFVFQPLARLQQGLARIETGDLAARVEVDADDEFGRVAQGFNRMAGRLDELYRGLEQKVAEKTEHLRTQRERLGVLYDASRFVARATTLQALADGFAVRLRAAAGADAALLRWHDEAHDRFVLLAHDGVPEAMLERERCVRAGDCRCGRPGLATGPVAIPIAVEPAAASSACQAHGFDRLTTVPVQWQDHLQGEITLLWRQPVGDLADEDRAMLESLASHLASGMESLRARALEREAAVSEERGLIARELHDSIAQSLAFMKIQIQLLRGALRRHDEQQTTQVVQELDAGVRESMSDVRELLLHFRTRAQGDDIVAALRSTLQKFQHQTGLAAHLDAPGAGLPLPADVQVQLLHVVQEALSNVRKHAGASQVWLTVQRQPHLRIEVRDDGQGFDGAAGADETHVGLRIMRERAAGIGAAVAVDSAPGRGTRVVVELPPAHAEAA